MDKSFSDGFAYNQTLQKPWVILKLNAQESWMPIGPFSETEVKDQLKSGEIKPTDYCWVSGWSDWKRIYLEPKFYLSRKPPLEFESVARFPQVPIKNAKDEELKTDKKNIWAELAHKISPLQYKGWKYKKNKNTEVGSSYNPNLTDSKDGVKNMLEPWDNKTKSLDFLEDSLKNNKDPGSATLENYPSDDLDSVVLSPNSGRRKMAVYALKFVLVMGMLFIISLITYRLYSVFINQSPINYSMSYFVVEDYMNELPEYLYARTDLKKNQQIKIRVFDLSNKQMRTKNSKAGLMLSSKGTGRMRIPMYAYALEPGVYKVIIEIEDQMIEKEFNITLNEASSEKSSALKK